MFYFQKYKTAEALLELYQQIYSYKVDIYSVDLSQVPEITDDYYLYLDWVLHKFVSLPKVTVPARIIQSNVDIEDREYTYLLTSGFTIGVLDLVLRKNRVSLRVGDIIATHRVFEELSQLGSFEAFTRPAFVRQIVSITPHTYVYGMLNVVEWAIRVSDTDIVFRYHV